MKTKSQQSPKSEPKGAPRSRSRRPSIVDVARRLGVHHTTVSLALRNSPQVSEATKARVRRMAAQIGYHPDPALALFVNRRDGRPHKATGYVVAFVTDRTPRHGLAQDAAMHAMYDGARVAAEARGFSADYFCIGEDGMTPARLQSVLRARNITAVVLAALTQPCGAVELDWQRLTAIKIESSHASPRLDAFCPNYAHGARLAMDRLRAHGSTRPGLVLTRAADLQSGGLFRGSYLREMQAPPAQLLPDVLLCPTRPGRAGKARVTHWLRTRHHDAVITDDPELGAALGEGPGGWPVVMLDAPAAGALGAVMANRWQLGESAVRLLALRWHVHETGAVAFPSIHYVPMLWQAGGAGNGHT